MKDYPEFRARSREEVDELLASQRLGRLIVVDQEGWPQVGLHPYTWDRGVLEGRYAAIDQKDPRYGKYMAALTLVRIEAREIRSKFKLGQRTSEEDRGEILRQLGERADPRDLLSVKAIEDANRAK